MHLLPGNSSSHAVEAYMELHGLPEITALAPGGIAETSGQVSVSDVRAAVNGVDCAFGPAAVGKLSGPL